MPFTIAARMMNADARMNAVNGMLGRHEVRVIGVRSIAAWGRILPEKILGSLPAVKGYRRNVSASLLVRERSCTGDTAGLSTPMVRLMEAGLDRVRSSRPLSYLA